MISLLLEVLSDCAEEHDMNVGVVHIYLFTITILNMQCIHCIVCRCYIMLLFSASLRASAAVNVG